MKLFLISLLLLMAISLVYSEEDLPIPDEILSDQPIVLNPEYLEKSMININANMDDLAVTKKAYDFLRDENDTKHLNVTINDTLLYSQNVSDNMWIMTEG